MKKLFVLLLIQFITFNNFAQTKIELGKKRYSITNNKIKHSNVGKIHSSFMPLFFKIDNQKYKKTGMYGGNIKMYLKMDNNKINHNFKSYKQNLFFSQIMLISSISLFSTWIYRGIKYNLNTGDDTPYQFLFYNKQIFFLTSYFFTFTGSVFFNLKSDKHLKRCVIINNKIT